MFIFIFFIIYYVLLCWTLSMLFEKAGIQGSKAWIPGVNFVEWCKLIGQKPTHALWLLFPIVNLFIITGMAVDLVRSFGRLKFVNTALAVVYAPIEFFLTAKDPAASYEGPILPKEKKYAADIKQALDSKNTYEYNKLVQNNPYKKSVAREWTESLVFAVFAASFIRMFLIEAFVIPTPSMEGSLNVGDFLFVSKAHYGIRTPSTIAMVPLLHNRMPIIPAESYLEKPSLTARRLPALEQIEVGKPIVFNWPVGDSVYLTSRRSYAAMQIEQDPGFMQSDPELIQLVRNKEIITRPIDKRDHYIKRCMGIAGDSMQIIDRQVYINGKAVKNPKHLQYLYIIGIPEDVYVSKEKLDSWGIDFGDSPNGSVVPQQGMLALFLDDEQVQKMKSIDSRIQVQLYKPPVEPRKIFPNHPTIYADWDVDNFGPLYIPKKGATVTLTPENIALYQRIINVYEANDFEMRDGKVFINGAEAISYTFKQDYYWAMGDNRHNSEDSRMWGFVPYDHIVGKPLFIWFSTKEGNMRNGINWDRIFKSATKD